jgi:hypothetical protein
MSFQVIATAMGGSIIGINMSVFRKPSPRAYLSNRSARPRPRRNSVVTPATVKTIVFLRLVRNSASPSIRVKLLIPANSRGMSGFGLIVWNAAVNM